MAIDARRNRVGRQNLLSLAATDQRPFAKEWDIHILFAELEERLGSQVIDIPAVDKGSNDYGFHVLLADGRDIIARLARSDVNMPRWVGFPSEKQISEVDFETAVQDLLNDEAEIPVSRVLYSRAPVKHVCQAAPPLTDILGRRLIVSERTEGRKAQDVWTEYDDEVKVRCTPSVTLDTGREQDEIDNSIARYSPPERLPASSFVPLLASPRLRLRMAPPPSPRLETRSLPCPSSSNARLLSRAHRIQA